MTRRIAIIGGGIGGLLCAYLLERLPGERPGITLLEAGARLGGRIETAEFEGHGVRYDAGAAEFYDITGAPQLRQLVEQLGLETRPLTATPTFFFEGRTLTTDQDFEDAFGAVALAEVDAFWELGTRLRTQASYAKSGHPDDNDHPWSGRTFASVLEDRIRDPAARRFTAMQCHSDLATEPELTNGTYGFDNLLIDHPAYNSMYTIVGGNELVVERLAAALDAEKRLHAPVRCVEARTDGRLAVTVDGDDPTTMTVDAAIVTPPTRCLERIEWSGGDLAAAMAAHVRHHSHPTSYLRVTLLFERRFWARDLPEDYFVADAFDGVTVYDQSPDKWDPDAHGVLSWLLGGAAADALSALDDDVIAEHILGSVPPPLRRARDALLAHRVDRWQDDRGVSRLPGGAPLLGLERRHRPDPGVPGLVVVGDYLYDATISGLVDAAAQGVHRVLEALGKSPLPTPSEILSLAGLGEGAAPLSTGEESGHLPFRRP